MLNKKGIAKNFLLSSNGLQSWVRGPLRGHQKLPTHHLHENKHNLILMMSYVFRISAGVSFHCYIRVFRVRVIFVCLRSSSLHVMFIFLMIKIKVMYLLVLCPWFMQYRLN